MCALGFSVCAVLWLTYCIICVRVDFSWLGWFILGLYFWFWIGFAGGCFRFILVWDYLWLLFCLFVCFETVVEHFVSGVVCNGC